MRSLHVPELRTQRKYRTAASIPIANAALVIAEQVCATWPSPGALDAARKPVHRTLALTMTMMCRADGNRTIALLGRIRIFVLSAAAEWRLLHGWPTRSWPPVQVSRVLGRTFVNVMDRVVDETTALGSHDTKRLVPLATMEDVWSRKCARDQKHM